MAFLSIIHIFNGAFSCLLLFSDTVGLFYFLQVIWGLHKPCLHVVSSTFRLFVYVKLSTLVSNTNIFYIVKGLFTHCNAVNCSEGQQRFVVVQS